MIQAEISNAFPLGRGSHPEPAQPSRPGGPRCLTEQLEGPAQRHLAPRSEANDAAYSGPKHNLWDWTFDKFGGSSSYVTPKHTIRRRQLLLLRRTTRTQYFSKELTIVA